MRRVKGMNEVRWESILLLHHVRSPKRIHGEVLSYVFTLALGVQAMLIHFFHVRLHDWQTEGSHPLNILSSH